MLEQAKRKNPADKVNWVRSPAENFHSDQKFDLITMTGHVFQIFTTEEAKDFEDNAIASFK